jgi:hypothetical protein
MPTARQLADKLQAQIEKDHRAAGYDPTTADLPHPDDDRLKTLNERANDS